MHAQHLTIAGARLTLADGEPFAVVTVWCPAKLGQSLSMADVEQHPFYEILDVELRGATQTIGAYAAGAADAALLEVPTGAPLLKCRRVTTDDSGHAVLMSEHLFPAHRTEFVGEQRGGHDGEGRVLVARGPDPSVQALATFDNELRHALLM